MSSQLYSKSGAPRGIWHRFDKICIPWYAQYMITGIDHIQLAMPIGEEDRARRFFTGVLGMVELAKPDSLSGVQELHVGVEAGFQPAKKAHPAFLVSDIDEIKAQLEGRGVVIITAPPLPGAERIFVADPFGNRIELIKRS